MEGQGDSPVEGGGVQRSEINCHHCGKLFVAELDLDISGNYIIECPHCGHEHYRSVENGKISDRRWGSDGRKYTKLDKVSVWKSSVIKAQTSAVAWHIRERWMQREDYYGR